MFTTVWESVLYEDKKLFWQYDFENKKIRTAKGHCKAYDEYGFDSNMMRTFYSMYEMAKQPLFDVAMAHMSIPVSGVEIYSSNGIHAYVGKVGNAYGYLLIRADDYIENAFSADDGFKIASGNVQNGFILINTTPIVCKLVLEDVEFKKKVLSHMVFRVRIGNVLIDRWGIW